MPSPRHSTRRRPSWSTARPAKCFPGWWAGCRPSARVADRERLAPAGTDDQGLARRGTEETLATRTGVLTGGVLESGPVLRHGVRDIAQIHCRAPALHAAVEGRVGH